MTDLLAIRAFMVDITQETKRSRYTEKWDSSRIASDMIQMVRMRSSQGDKYNALGVMYNVARLAALKDIEPVLTAPDDIDIYYFSLVRHMTDKDEWQDNLRYSQHDGRTWLSLVSEGPLIGDWLAAAGNTGAVAAFRRMGIYNLFNLGMVKYLHG